jgi:hypothetical protein
LQTVLRPEFYWCVAGGETSSVLGVYGWSAGAMVEPACGGVDEPDMSDEPELDEQAARLADTMKRSAASGFIRRLPNRDFISTTPSLLRWRIAIGADQPCHFASQVDADFARDTNGDIETLGSHQMASEARPRRKRFGILSLPRGASSAVLRSQCCVE